MNVRNSVYIFFFLTQQEFYYRLYHCSFFTNIIVFLFNEFQKSDVGLEEAQYPFATLRERSVSFGQWIGPNRPTLKEEFLAQQGFFYLGPQDLAQCWICNGQFRVREADYNPNMGFGHNNGCIYAYLGLLKNSCSHIVN